MSYVTENYCDFSKKMLLGLIIIIIIISIIFLYFKSLQMFSKTTLFWSVFLVSVALSKFHNAEGNFLVLFVFQGCTLQFVVLSDFVLRRWGAFHNAKDNLWFWFLLRHVFLVVCISVWLGPQIMSRIPHCRGLLMVFICFVRCIPCGLSLLLSFDSNHGVYSTL